RTSRTGLAARPGDFAALIEKILHPRPRRVIGDEVELIPEAVQFLLPLLVQNQLLERGIVAPVPHHVVVAGAQQPPLVLGVVGKEAPALTNVECIGENRAEAREGSLVASPVALRYGRVEI